MNSPKPDPALKNPDPGASARKLRAILLLAFGGLLTLMLLAGLGALWQLRQLHAIDQQVSRRLINHSQALSAVVISVHLYDDQLARSILEDQAAGNDQLAHDSQDLLVGDVSPNSPAKAAGLKRGDIILTVNGKTMTDSNQLRMDISMMQPGDEARLQVIRDGNPRDFNIKLNELPNEKAENDAPETEQQHALEGVEVETLTPETAQELNLPQTTTGVLVKRVSPSIPLADSGLRRGDVIQEVNHTAVKSVSDLRSAIGKDAKDPLLLVNRGGQTSSSAHDHKACAAFVGSRYANPGTRGKRSMSFRF